MILGQEKILRPDTKGTNNKRENDKNFNTFKGQVNLSNGLKVRSVLGGETADTGR